MTQNEPNALRKARFERGATALSAMPAGAFPEVAFAGRSNAGKSSAINALAARRALARVSREPGRTREFNFFAVPGGYLVDLPGFGYARASATLRVRWARLMERYLRERTGLRGVVLFMDARRDPGSEELALLGWSARAGVAMRLVLTKADKLSRAAAATRLHTVRRQVNDGGDQVAVQLLSSRRGDGVNELRTEVLRWLCEGVGGAPERRGR